MRFSRLRTSSAGKALPLVATALIWTFGVPSAVPGNARQLFARYAGPALSSGGSS